MGRQYTTPPVVEALCEFQFTEDTPWDLTIPGRLYEKIKGDFPHREQRLIQAMELRQEGPQIQFVERVIFFSTDRSTLVQLGPRLLAINVLKPYPSWENFKSYIQKTWNALQEVVEIQGLERIGLRYINRIHLPEPARGLDTYFEFYPFIGPRLPQEWSAFIVGVEYPYADKRDRCRVQLTSADSDEPKPTVILDIDYFLARSKGIPISATLEWLEQAHDRIEEIFEGCITEELRTTFR